MLNKELRSIILAISVFTAVSCALIICAFSTCKISFKNKNETTAIGTPVAASHEPAWSEIENQSFEIDMKKLEVVLIKRSFNSGSEATLIRYQSGQEEYFMCSKETHEKLVRQFQAMLNEKESGF